MEQRVTNDKKENEKVVGFRVDPKEYNILKQYTQIFSTTNRFKSLGQSKTADYLKLAISVFWFEMMPMHIYLLQWKKS
jgi:hypothetical protein